MAGLGTGTTGDMLPARWSPFACPHSISRPRSIPPIGELRRDGHHMLDDMFDHLERLRGQPVWQAPA